MIRDIDEVVEVAVPISILLFGDHVVVEEDIGNVIDGEAYH